MLMLLMCSKCSEDIFAAATDIPPNGIPVPTKVVPVQTVGLYRGVCDRGHPVVMIAEFQQFELLFESAMEAFVDTYYRESVSSFAASLERYFEFAIQTLLLARGINKDTIAAMWKKVSSQSERQLGMYIGLYTSTFGKPPRILTTEESSFRNNVIHKGYFPTPQETFEFANSVYEILNSSIRELRGNFQEAIGLLRVIEREKVGALLKPGENPTFFGMGTTVSIMTLDDPRPLESALNELAERMRRDRNSTSSMTR